MNPIYVFDAKRMVIIPEEDIIKIYTFKGKHMQCSLKYDFIIENDTVDEFWINYGKDRIFNVVNDRSRKVRQTLIKLKEDYEEKIREQKMYEDDE